MYYVRLVLGNQESVFRRINLPIRWALTSNILVFAIFKLGGILVAYSLTNKSHGDC
jgi:hypothetical protein